MRRLTKDDIISIQTGELITQAGLFDRGWTRGQIRKYLPEPELYENPVFKSGSPAKVWDYSTVYDAEQRILGGLWLQKQN